MSEYADLVLTARRAGLGARSPVVYVLHRAECARIGAKPLALDSYRPGDPYGGPEGLLRKVRQGLNAKACSYCKPDATRRA